MEVERQDPRCQALVKAPSLAGSLARTMPKNVHITQDSYLARSVPKKIYISQCAHHWRLNLILCKKCANKYWHNSAQHRHIPPRVKTFAETKNGHRGTLNKGRSRTEKESRQDLGHFLTAKDTLFIWQIRWTGYITTMRTIQFSFFLRIAYAPPNPSQCSSHLATPKGFISNTSQSLNRNENTS